MRTKNSLILIGLLLLVTFVTGCGTDPGKGTTGGTEGGPSTPTNLTATVVGSGQIDLSWTASTDDKGVTGYYIYSEDTQVADVTTTTYSRSGLSPDTAYCHTVKAYDADGKVSIASNQVCAKTTQKVDVSALISAAKLALENQDIPTAKAKFEEAYAGDSTNKDANFGLAMTEGIMLIEDPDVINIIEKWGGYAPKVKDVVYGVLGDTSESHSSDGTVQVQDLDQDQDQDQDTFTLSKAISGNKESDTVNQFKELVGKLPKNRVSLLKKIRIAVERTIPSTAPTVSEMQTVIDNKILHILDDMIKKVRTVEGTDYTFTITPAMTGSSETQNTILDDGEFYAFHASLDAIKALLNIVTAYNLDVDYDIVEADPLSVLNGPSGGLTSSVDASKFFTLKSNGAAKMTAAIDALKDAADKAELCYTFVFNQWGYGGSDNLWPVNNITDNGLKWHDPEDFYSFQKSDDDDVRNILDAVQLGLKGQVTFNETTIGSVRTKLLTDGTTTINFGSEPTHNPDKAMSLVFNVPKLFSNPLDRTNLPTMGYDLPIDGNLSKQYDRPIHKIENDETIESEIVNTSDVPDWTFKGILPNGFPDQDAMIYHDETILLPAKVSWGDSWSENIAMGGDGYIYLRKEYYPDIKLFKIDPSNWSILDTTTGLRGYGANNINWIKERVWHDGAMWASGGFYNASTQYKQGIFNEVSGDLGLADYQIPFDSNVFERYTGGIASDGTNLYVGISYYNWDGTGNTGVVKVNPSSDTSIPLSPFVIETTHRHEAPGSLVYGGNYLWMEGGAGTLKVNPATGAIVKRYTGETGFEMYYNNRLWRVQGRRLQSFIAP
ncbi:MAG TPA: hypothetical protein DDX84_00860 [Nitrospiraceae bacterium]|nr:hypothetical protein [Nitrospiraceae bacterium]